MKNMDESQPGVNNTTDNESMTQIIDNGTVNTLSTDDVAKGTIDDFLKSIIRQQMKSMNLMNIVCLGALENVKRTVHDMKFINQFLNVTKDNIVITPEGYNMIKEAIFDELKNQWGLFMDEIDTIYDIEIEEDDDLEDDDLEDDDLEDDDLEDDDLEDDDLEDDDLEDDDLEDDDPEDDDLEDDDLEDDDPEDDDLEDDDLEDDDDDIEIVEDDDDDIEIMEDDDDDIEIMEDDDDDIEIVEDDDDDIESINQKEQSRKI